MDGLPGFWSLTPLGGLVGAIAFAYWGLITGRIIPRSSHERELQAAKERGDEWKNTATELQQVNAEIRDQNSKLIEANRTATAFFARVSLDIEDTGTHDVGP